MTPRFGPRSSSTSRWIVTLSGRGRDNPSRGFGHLNFYVPRDRYGWIEPAHHIVLHYWLDTGIEEICPPGVCDNYDLTVTLPQPAAQFYVSNTATLTLHYEWTSTQPTDMDVFAFAPNGDFFVGDGYGSHHILRFSRAGKFLGEIGRPGHGDGEFDTPHGLWVDLRAKEPALLVADRGNRRIQAFTLAGTHIRTIKDEAHLRMPCHFHTQGDWMVCPDLDSQVCILDRNYNVVAQLGDGKAANGEVGSRRNQSRSQFTPGQFITPHAAIFLQGGNILVAEWLPIGRITLLRRV